MILPFNGTKGILTEIKKSHKIKRRGPRGTLVPLLRYPLL
jgi:hypothetical protein